MLKAFPGAEQGRLGLALADHLFCCTPVRGLQGRSCIDRMGYVDQDRRRALLVYFVTLPDPVVIPRNMALHFVYDERRTPYFATPAFNEDVASFLLRVGGPDDVALSFIQVPAAPGEYQIRFGAAVAALEFFKGDASAPELVKPDSFSGPDGRVRAARVVTVVQIAVFDDSSTDASPQDTELEDPSAPALRALNCVEHFVRSYNLSANAPARLPTYMRVGPSIPVLRKDLPIVPGAEWDVHVEALNHENIAVPAPKMPDMDTIVQITQNVQLLSAGDIRSVFQSEMIEAERLYFAEGEYASAIVKCAQACEILFDGVLGLLLWEECGEAPRAEGPIDVAVEVFSKALIPRVRSEYHARLGGKWDPGTEGPVADWSRRVAGPRNRVVHRGYRPVADEAGGALESVVALDDYISSLIASKAKKFPRTALMWVTEAGLKDRGRWQMVRAFAQGRRLIEPPWRDNYGAWRERVDAAVSSRQYKR